MLAIPNVSSKFCDVWRGDEAHLGRMGQDHLGPVAEKADKPGHANPLPLQRHFRGAELRSIVSKDHRGQRLVRTWLFGADQGEKCQVGSRVGLVIGRGDQTTDLSGMASHLQGSRSRPRPRASTDSAPPIRSPLLCCTLLAPQGGGRSIHVAKGLRSR